MIELVRARLPRRIGPSAGVAAGLVVGVVLAAVAIPRRQPVAVQAGGTTATDAYKALAIVGAWALAGVVWVAANPNMRGTRVFDRTAPKRNGELVTSA